MCTVVVDVPGIPHEAVRILAVRDEDPLRPWDPPGYWWPEHGDVAGVRDRRANGAWLAARPTAGRFAVLLNRVESPEARVPDAGYTSRGRLVLDEVTGVPIPAQPRTAAFNLLAVDSGESRARVSVISWDGVRMNRQELEPGVHMLAHHDTDDADRTSRIAAWLPEFRLLDGLGEDWREHWIATLTRTAALPADDDRAILRDNRAHGYPTQSLLACLAEISPTRLDLHAAVFPEPVTAGVSPSLQFHEVPLLPTLDG